MELLVSICSYCPEVDEDELSAPLAKLKGFCKARGENGPPELGVYGFRGDRAFTTFGRAISSSTDGAT